MKIIKSDLLISHLNPTKLIQFCENEANYLKGLESWIKYKFKLRFDVNIFTCVQKEHARCPFKEGSYAMNGNLIVGPRYYEAILKIAE